MNSLIKILATRVFGIINVYDILMWAVLSALYMLTIPVIGIWFTILFAVILSLGSGVVSLKLETKARSIS